MCTYIYIYKYDMYENDVYVQCRIYSLSLSLFLFTGSIMFS